ncbi:MAG: NADPH-dependent assimilatory sulfite reductase hemoprotein subunit [Acidobacteriota bacterium]
MEEKKKSRAEIVKENSQGLRGAIATELGEGSRHFTSENAQLLKFHGIYQQDDRDLRAHLRAEGKDRKYFFMIRTKNPGGGELSPEQWEILNRVSGQYANGTLRITARQDIQFHGVGKENLKGAIALLNSELISTYGACGDGNRNTMACPVANIRKGSVFDGQAVACEITKHLGFKSRAYYEIWLDGEKITTDEPETIYGGAYLPRKLKIGVAYPDDNCIDVYTHDIGIVPVLDATRVEGFTVLIGGGMGSTHGKKETFPRLGEPLGFVFTDGLLEVVTRIVEFQRDHGNRGDRSRARLKYVVEDWGIERVRAEIEARLGWKLAAARPVCFPPGELHLGWHRQNEPGRWYVGIFVENGRIKDTEGCRMLTGLREIVCRFGPAVRLTPSQDLILSGIPEEKVELVRGALKDYRIPTEKQVSNLRRHALACPALPTCGLAITEAERRLPYLIDALEGLGYGNEEISIRMSGCPNSCSRPPTAEIGLIGRFKNKYNIYVGGSPQGARLAQLYAEAAEPPDLIREIARLIDVYRVHRQPQEHFGDFCHRIGIARLHELAENQHGAREEILRKLFWSPTDEEMEEAHAPVS